MLPLVDLEIPEIDVMLPLVDLEILEIDVLITIFFFFNGDVPITLPWMIHRSWMG